MDSQLVSFLEDVKAGRIRDAAQCQSILLLADAEVERLESKAHELGELYESASAMFSLGWPAELTADAAACGHKTVTLNCFSERH
jgi:hypothetical protein